ncbi:MAG: hypothetical protein ABSH02_03375 [Candidatus Sulfotelmatobacter sp.]|jgi:hypothetical protein
MSRKKTLIAAALLLLFTPLIVAQLTVPIAVVGSEDIGAQINAAFAACSYTCVVSIPAGNYSYRTTINMTKPGQSLVGAGSYATILNYSGSGDGIFWQMSSFNSTKAGALRGLSVIGTSSATNCIHSGSLQGSTWDDVTVSGCTGTTAYSGAGSNGILLENVCQGGTGSSCTGGVRAFTERTYMHNVHIGYSGQSTWVPGNTNGLHLLVNGGTYSFGYSEFDVWLNVEGSQIGLLVDTSAQLYHSDVALKGNMQTGPGSFLTVAGQLTHSTLNIMAEASYAPQPDAIHVTSTGVVYAQGNAQIFATTTAGGTALPLIDAGGSYAVEPWVALDFPATMNSDLFSTQQIAMPMIETGSQYITADGTIVVAQPHGTAAVAGDLNGRLVLSWPSNTNRSAMMIIDVACAQYESVAGCSFNVPVNYAYTGQAVFTSPTIKLNGGSPSVPQIQVTIGNRNGVSQSVIATWYGSAGASTNAGGPTLFPGTSPGTTAIPLVGLTSDGAGNLTTGQQMIVGSIKTAGTAPSCTFTSGGGTSPSCSLDTGSTNAAGTIIVSTGAGSPSGTGTITLTFNSSPFGTNKPVCMYQASDAGTGIWNGLAVMKDKTPSTSSDLFTWTNGTTPVTLSASTAYRISYHCWAK